MYACMCMCVHTDLYIIRTQIRNDGKLKVTVNEVVIIIIAD